MLNNRGLSGLLTLFICSLNGRSRAEFVVPTVQYERSLKRPFIVYFVLLSPWRMPLIRLRWFGPLPSLLSALWIAHVPKN